VASTHGYYDESLSGERLRRVYEIAPARVKQYLEAEVHHVMGATKASDTVLDMGCGYGRIMPRLAGRVRLAVGIDTSPGSLLLARRETAGIPNCLLVLMDASRMAFRGSIFDVVVCIQNGISAFHVDQRDLIVESLRVTKPGGVILFSTYSDRFWSDRLQWFRLQADAGLLGEIDDDRTGAGVIICKDGFTATTVGPGRFMELTRGLDVDVRVVEVDQSSIFYEVVRR
jgi:2-polyprenyl-6-hydroxyphenyl methylase/3-demethylubiquinone-9 3-methyltransferase